MTRTIRMAGLAALAISLFAPRARGQEPRALLMMDITPQGVPPEVARSLTDYLELEIERGRLYSVISQQDLRTLIKVEEQKLLMGDDKEFNQRISEIAKRVDARYVLASTLGRVGEAYLLSLELLDAGEVRVLRRVNQTLIGEEQELIGSLRSAVLALTLDEKGVAPDISEDLIDTLRISEKEKSLFLSLSPAYETPIGRRLTGAIPSLRPSFFFMRLDAEFPVWRWIRLYGSVSLGTTINAQHFAEDDHQTVVFQEGVEEPVAQRLQANQMQLDYSTLKIPVNLGVKLIPETGRFLPYLKAGVGISWQGYSFDHASVDVLREPELVSSGPPEEYSCPPPFGLDDEGGPPVCLIDGIAMELDGDVSALGFDAVAAAGFEWLLTHHLGILAEIRYRLTLAFDSADDLRFRFQGQSEPYDFTTPEGDIQRRQDRHLEVFTLQDLNEVLVFSVGMVMYW